MTIKRDIMVEALYMDDSYLKEWDAAITSVSNEKFIILDKTAFYPKGGGVEWDTGILNNNKGEAFKVIYTGKFKGTISHEVDKPGLKAGDTVQCSLDWGRRYLLMRYHTATHVLSGVLFKEYNLKVTGNQITTDKARMDLNMEEMNEQLIKDAIQKSNDLIQQDLQVEIYYKSRTQAEQEPDLFKLAMGFPHDIDTLRIVDIKGFDRQADGGCHIQHLKEIGTLHFQSYKNKGKNFKRVYFTIE
jgi:misacylated tRNA(Ala) deacylase